MNLSKAEQEIIDILREAKPYEKVVVVKDSQGRPDHYFVERTQKVVIGS